VVYNVRKHNSPLELYNLQTDEGEQNNVADQHPDVVANIQAIMNSARTESDIFKFKGSTLSGH
jgi:predicted fused transcriptional regulator/phosphomethylpyrimidine kinase